MHIARPVRRVGECSIAFVRSAVRNVYGDVGCQILVPPPCDFNQVGLRTQTCPVFDNWNFANGATGKHCLGGIQKLTPNSSQTLPSGKRSLARVCGPCIGLGACGQFSLGREAPMHTRHNNWCTSPIRTTQDDDRVPAIGRHLSLATGQRVLFGFEYHFQNLKSRRVPLRRLMHINAKLCSADGKAEKVWSDPRPPALPATP
jgi:hypothetical protein